MNARLLLGCALLFTHTVTAAATITVSSLADSGSGSLRAAVASAAAGDVINITATGTLTLTSGEIALTRALTINGPGSALLTLSGNDASRLFKVSVTTAGAADAPVLLSGMTLSAGRAAGSCPAPASGSGGAIAATESLSLTDVVITASHAARNGGAIAWVVRRAGQALTLNNVSLSGNSAGCAGATAGALGGGLFAGYDAAATAGSSGTLTINASTFATNTALRSGGAIALAGPVNLTVTASRIVGNAATAEFGGGVYLAPPALSTLATPQASFVRSEIADNTAALAGGGIAVANAAAALQGNAQRSALGISNSTVSGNAVSAVNADAAAINLAGNTGLTLHNSTVAANRLSAASSGASIARSVCAGSVEPLATLTSAIVAQTNDGASPWQDIGDSGATLTQPWSASNTLVRRAAVTLSGSANITGSDPQLIALAWNGGSTRSHALASSSPAINAGSNPLALAIDQRGAARSYGAAADMGAIESPFAAARDCTFDIDGDGVLDAATDGLLIARVLAGFTQDSAVTGALSASATRSTWASIDGYLTACGYRSPASACSFDLDGDGQMNAVADGALTLRLLGGLASDTLLLNAANPAGSRANWAALKSHLNANCGFALP